MSITSPKWLALAREASSAAEHVAFGVTALGRANYAQDAYYTQSFFSLSIGFERSCKIGLLLDHALENAGAFPDSRTLRMYGHDLQKLLRLLESIGQKRRVKEPRPSSSVHEGIVRTLSEFATNVTRYYNLEFLAGDVKTATGQDPIAAWSHRVTEAVLQKHYKKRYREKHERQAHVIDALFGDNTFVLFHGETGEIIHSMYGGSVRTAAAEFARRWERMYVLQIMRFVAEVLIELTHQADAAQLEVPSLSGVFAIFLNDDAYFRDRRTWSIFHR